MRIIIILILFAFAYIGFYGDSKIRKQETKAAITQVATTEAFVSPSVKIVPYGKRACEHSSPLWKGLVDKFKDIYQADGRYYLTYLEEVTFYDTGAIDALEKYQHVYPGSIIVSTYDDTDNKTATKVFTGAK